MTDRLAYAGILLCLAAVLWVESWGMPVIAGEGVLYGTGSMAGGCFQSGSCAANDGQSVTSVQDNRARVEQGGRLPVTEAPAGDTDGTFYLRPVAVAGEKASALETVGLSSASLEAGPVGVSTGTLLPPATATYLHPVDRSSVSDRSKESTYGMGSDWGIPGAVAGSELADLPGDTPVAIATWVHPSLHGNVQADGRSYSRWNVRYAASNDFELGTVLELRHDGRAIVVEVQDRGLMGEGHLDISEAGFSELADLDVGVIEVEVREP